MKLALCKSLSSFDSHDPERSGAVPMFLTRRLLCRLLPTLPPNTALPESTRPRPQESLLQASAFTSGTPAKHFQLPTALSIQRTTDLKCPTHTQWSFSLKSDFLSGFFIQLNDFFQHLLPTPPTLYMPTTLDSLDEQQVLECVLYFPISMASMSPPSGILFI